VRNTSYGAPVDGMDSHRDWYHKHWIGDDFKGLHQCPMAYNVNHGLYISKHPTTFWVLHTVGKAR
jgi:hypothetical protein